MKRIFQSFDTLFGRMALVMIVTLILAQILNVIVLIGQQKLSYIAQQESQAIAQFVDRTQVSLHTDDAVQPISGSDGAQLYVITENPVLAPAQNHGMTSQRDDRLSRRLSNALSRSMPTIQFAPEDVHVDLLEGPLRSLFVGDVFATFGVPQFAVTGAAAENEPSGAPTIGQVQFRALLLSVKIGENTWLNSLHLTRQIEPGLGWRIVIATVLLILLTLTVSLLFMRQLARPFNRLAKAADSVRAGETGVSLDEEGSGDVRRTIAAFNALNESRDRLIETQHRMIGAVGHDMRTPLTVLRLCAEKIEDPVNQTRMIASIEEAQDMLQSILNYTQESTTPETLSKIDIMSLVDVLCADYEELGKPVTYTGPLSGQAVTIRASQFKRALRNLIENAVKYGGNANVSVSTTQTAVQIRVDDDGPGVNQADLERIQEPFQRGEQSRNRETGGTGLGLPIVKTIIESHGGHLEISNRPEGGFRAEIVLPI